MNEPEQIPENAIVLRRPHFRLAGSDLFFLISRRPHASLNATEAAIFSAIGEETPIADLRSRFAEQADAAVRRFVRIGACDLATSQSPPNRRRVLVVEPHSDDAALSVGATMWMLRDSCEFTIATIASRSNFTSYYYSVDRDFLDIGTISSLRAAEGRIVARRVGGRYLALGQPEATVRGRDHHWSLDWFRQHQGSILVSSDRSGNEDDLRDWTATVATLLRDVPSEEVWMPIAVGHHADHQLARDACLSALIKQPSLVANRIIKLYQDVPYAVRDPEYTPALLIALADAGANLTPEPVSVESAFAEKLKLISVYGSQFKLSALLPDIEACARLAAGSSGKAEMFWRLNKIPSTLDRLSLYHGRKAVERTIRRLASWYPRHRDAHQMRVLLLVPSGRWVKDAEILLQYFPSAIFDVYVAPAGIAEVVAFESPRIRVHRVGAGIKAWTMLSAKLMLCRPAPTLFTAGSKRLNAARGLAALWPLSDPLVIASMDHFTLALQQLNRSA